MDVHDGIVLPFVAIHFLRQSTRRHQTRDKTTPFPLTVPQQETPIWPLLPSRAQPAWAAAKLLCLWTTFSTDLVKVQPDDDVGFLCQLVNLLQESHVPDICRSV